MKWFRQSWIVRAVLPTPPSPRTTIRTLSTLRPERGISKVRVSGWGARRERRTLEHWPIQIRRKTERRTCCEKRGARSELTMRREAKGRSLSRTTVLGGDLGSLLRRDRSLGFLQHYTAAHDLGDHLQRYSYSPAYATLLPLSCFRPASYRIFGRMGQATSVPAYHALPCSSPRSASFPSQQLRRAFLPS